MTVRAAELLMAILCALGAIALMVKSAELNIGWIEGRGPGSGAWPFWLSAGMLMASITIGIRWYLHITPESRSGESFMDRSTVTIVGISAGAILFLLIFTHLVGIYIALAGFLVFYLRFVGRHSWRLTTILALAIPIVVFCLFEWALKIPLPKSITETWFYPIYDLIY